MPLVNSRQTLKDYCKRKLGFPVVQINIDDDQMDDRIDDALQWFQDYHFDGMEKIYLKHLVSMDDINRQWIDMNQASGTATVVAGSNVVQGDPSTNFINDFANNVTVMTINGETYTMIQAQSATSMVMSSPFINSANQVPIAVQGGADSIFAVTRIFPFSSSNLNVNMFDLRYQMRLHELYDFTSTSYVNYTITQQHIQTLDILFSGKPIMRYNRHQNRLYLDLQWGEAVKVGDYIVAECWKFLEPDAYTTVYNDRYLKSLAAAFIKRQWGENLLKYQGVKLPGGINFNGQRMFDEASKEIDDLIGKIQDMYESPPELMIG